jgi:maleamate amidohydrolase
MKVYPASTGRRAWVAVSHGKVLLDQARARGYLVTYTVRDETSAIQASQPRREKHDLRLPEPEAAADVVETLAPLPGEAVVRKAKPSAFHGTPLLSLLVYHRIDTLVVIGGVTSGCVRATVVDAFSLGYRVVIPEDAVFDRSELLHAVSLFDMDQKYGDVCPSTQVASYLTDPTNDAARG